MLDARFRFFINGANDISNDYLIRVELKRVRGAYPERETPEGWIPTRR